MLKARTICENIARLGFSNRGVKEGKRLYFLRHTSEPAILIEVCFVDDEDDAKLYKKCKNQIAAANGIKNYTGTAAQNTKMLNMMKSGDLVKPTSSKKK